MKENKWLFLLVCFSVALISLNAFSDSSKVIAQPVQANIVTHQSWFLNWFNNVKTFFGIHQTIRNICSGDTIRPVIVDDSSNPALQMDSYAPMSPWLLFGQADIAVDQPIKIKFSKVMSMASINNDTIKLYEGYMEDQSKLVDTKIEYAASENMVTITPVNKLKYATNYSLHIGGEKEYVGFNDWYTDTKLVVKDLCGNSLLYKTAMNFRTICSKDETDAGCGGNCGSKCTINKKCKNGSDCESNLCYEGYCQTVASICSNSKLDEQYESDLDCGGQCSNKCDVNRKCANPSDCKSNICQNGYCQIKNIGETCSNDYECSSYNCQNHVCNLAKDVLSEYNKMLTSPKINSAIGTLAAPEINYLSSKIFELEAGNITDYDSICYTTGLDKNTKRLIWLKHVALSIYVDRNNIVPWKLTNYSQTDLNTILSYDPYHIDSLLCEDIPPYQKAILLKSGYLNQTFSQLDFVQASIYRLRTEGWIHVSSYGGEAFYEWKLQGWNDYPDLNRMFFSTLDGFKTSASWVTSFFMVSLSRAFNISARVELESDNLPHNFYCFPTINVCYDGDRSAYVTVPHPSVENSWYSYSTINNWKSESVQQSSCEQTKLDIENIEKDLPEGKYDMYFNLCHHYHSSGLISELTDSDTIGCYSQLEIANHQKMLDVENKCKPFPDLGEMVYDFKDINGVFKLYPFDIIIGFPSNTENQNIGIKFIGIDNKFKSGALPMFQVVKRNFKPDGTPAFSQIKTLESQGFVNEPSLNINFEIIGFGTEYYGVIPVPFVKIKIVKLP